jgi:hypothetical protein
MDFIEVINDQLMQMHWEVGMVTNSYCLILYLDPTYVYFT